MSDAPEPAPSKASAPRSRRREILARVGLVIVSLIVGAGLAEVAARITTPKQRSISWYHYDTRYGFRHKSNVDAVTTDWGDGEPWQFRTNERGFRGEEWPDSPPDGMSRVLLSGDSFTVGNGVDEENSFPRVAHEALRAEGRSIEVRNLAVSAWSPSFALAYLDSEGRDIHASCLVYAFFEGNDVIDATSRPLYSLENGVLRPAASLDVAQSASTEWARDLMRALPLYDALLAHSQLFNLVRNGAIQALAGTDPANQAVIDAVATEDREGYARALDLNDAVLHELAAHARERFGTFAVVAIPERGQIYPSADLNATPFPLWMAEASHARLAAWAAREAVPLYDLAPDLPHGEREIAELYWTKDFHLSDKGARRVGELLAKKIPELCGIPR